MKRSLLVALGAAVSMLGSGALAQEKGSAADARCLVAMVALSSGGKTPEAAEVGRFGVAYYAGRIRTEDPAYDFKSRLPKLTTGLTRDAVQSEAARCGPPVLAVVQQVTAAFPMRPQSQSAKPAPARPMSPKPAP